MGIKFDRDGYPNRTNVNKPINVPRVWIFNGQSLQTCLVVSQTMHHVKLRPVTIEDGKPVPGRLRTFGKFEVFPTVQEARSFTLAKLRYYLKRDQEKIATVLVYKPAKFKLAVKRRLKPAA